MRTIAAMTAHMDTRQCIAAAEVLLKLGYYWTGEVWEPPLTGEIVDAGDYMHAVLVRRADALTECVVEGSDAERELAELREAILRYEEARWPEGEVAVRGKG